MKTRRCRICNGPIREKNLIGICRRNDRCNAAHALASYHRARRAKASQPKPVPAAEPPRQPEQLVPLPADRSIRKNAVAHGFMAATLEILMDLQKYATIGIARIHQLAEADLPSTPAAPSADDDGVEEMPGAAAG